MGSYVDSIAETPGIVTSFIVSKTNKIAGDMSERLTEDNNTNVDRTRYFGDPFSALDRNSKTMFPSFKQRLNNSAHTYVSLQIADKVPVHEAPKNYPPTSPDDAKAKVIME